MTITKLRHKKEYTPPEIGIEDIEGVTLLSDSANMNNSDIDKGGTGNTDSFAPSKTSSGSLIYIEDSFVQQFEDEHQTDTDF